MEKSAALLLALAISSCSSFRNLFLFISGSTFLCWLHFQVTCPKQWQKEPPAVLILVSLSERGSVLVAAGLPCFWWTWPLESCISCWGGVGTDCWTCRATYPSGPKGEPSTLRQWGPSTFACWTQDFYLFASNNHTEGTINMRRAFLFQLFFISPVVYSTDMFEDVSFLIFWPLLEWFFSSHPIFVLSHKSFLFVSFYASFCYLLAQAFSPCCTCYKQQNSEMRSSVSLLFILWPDKPKGQNHILQLSVTWGWGWG